MKLLEKFIRLYHRLVHGAQPINRRMVHPFTEAELKPVPEGWKVGGPDFIGIGCGKAGTSWWYELLLDHPAIQPNRLGIKELNYFYHFGLTGPSSSAVATYRRAFAAPGGKLCGEWSPGYLTHPLVPRWITRAAPDARLLAIVRNPVDRVRSALNMQILARPGYLGLTGDRTTFYRTFSILPRVLDSSRLLPGIRDILSFYDRTRILVLQYEKLKQDPGAGLAATYRFLGVDPAHRPGRLTRRVNVIPHRTPSLTPAERSHLADHFRTDVEELASLFPEIDLSLWPDFS